MTSFAANTACAKPYPAGLRPASSIPAACFFSRVVLLLCTFTGPVQSAQAVNPADATACRTSHYDVQATIKNIIDGDTVILADERHVRLIGINTPEISRNDQPSQAGANEAYHYLNNLLHTQKSVRLHYDMEHTDQYGRTLAHLFLQDGTNIQSLLLKRGLATTLTIPPNLAFLDCYESSASHARARGIGLWALRQYQPLPVSALTGGGLGYRIITGSVVRTGTSKSNTWINIDKRLSLRIAARDLHYFGELGKLVGTQIRARGRLYYSNGEYRMQIRHPVDLKIINTPAPN